MAGFDLNSFVFFSDRNSHYACNCITHHLLAAANVTYAIITLVALLKSECCWWIESCVCWVLLQFCWCSLASGQVWSWSHYPAAWSVNTHENSTFVAMVLWNSWLPQHFLILAQGKKSTNLEFTLIISSENSSLAATVTGLHISQRIWLLWPACQKDLAGYRSVDL